MKNRLFLNKKEIINILGEEYNDLASIISDKFGIINAILERNELKKYSLIASMNQIVVSSIDKPIIGTTALDTCYGIVFYDRKNKKGAVGHAPPSNKISILRQMIRIFDTNEVLEIEYGIVPGIRNEERKDYSAEEELFSYLMNNKPKNISFIPFKSDLGVEICPNVYAYEFAFDVNSGKSVSDLLFYNTCSLEESKKTR